MVGGRGVFRVSLGGGGAPGIGLEKCCHIIAVDMLHLCCIGKLILTNYNDKII